MQEGRVMERSDMSGITSAPTPRACLASTSVPPPERQPAPRPDPHEDPQVLETLVRLVVRAPWDDVLDHLDTLRAAGWSDEAIQERLLAPAARRLGVLWAEDSVTFADVTAGLGGLRRMLHAVTSALDPDLGWRPESEPRGRALMVTAAGEQHSLGLAMVSDLFRREGWEVLPLAEATPAMVAGLITGGGYDLLGVSVGTHGRLATAAALVRAARTAAAGAPLEIMAGGSVFLAAPDADETALPHLPGADLHDRGGVLARRIAQRGAIRLPVTDTRSESATSL